MTQLEIARQGNISREMEAVALAEGLDAECVRQGVAGGKVVILANVRHSNLDVYGVGAGLATKVNANIGTSSDFGDIATEIEALRSLIYRVAWMVDTGQPFSREAAICKVYGSEVASRAIDKAVQVHGALGLTRDFAIERAFRDARISEIFEGTSEIQRIVIATDIFREHGVRIRP